MPKRKVGISVDRGLLRISLPRGLFNGKQKFIHLGLKDTSENRKIAQRKAEQIQNDIIFNNFDQSLEKYKTFRKSENKLTLIEIYQRFMDFKKDFIRPGTFKNGYKVMESHLRKSPYLHSSPEDKQLPHDLINWAKSNLTVNTAKRFLVQINACIEWAIERELIELQQSPFKTLSKSIRSKSRKAEEIDPFTLEQRNTIIEHYRNHPKHHHYALFVAFCFFTGCRPSEAIALEKKNLSADLRRITFTHAVVEGEGGRKRITGLKTQEQRTIYTSESVQEILREALNRSSNQILFPGVKGGYLGSRSFRRSWQLILEELNLEYRKPYQMRHTFITLCLEAGINIKDIAKMAGNSPEMIYRHYAENTRKVVVPDL